MNRKTKEEQMEDDINRYASKRYTDNELEILILGYEEILNKPCAQLDIKKYSITSIEVIRESQRIRASKKTFEDIKKLSQPIMEDEIRAYR